MDALIRDDRMTIDGLDQWLGATPFKTFVMSLTNERKVRVRHPESVARSPTGRTTIVYTTGDAFELVDLLHGASVKQVGGNRHCQGSSGSTRGA